MKLIKKFEIKEKYDDSVRVLNTIESLENSNPVITQTHQLLHIVDLLKKNLYIIKLFTTCKESRIKNA